MTDLAPHSFFINEFSDGIQRSLPGSLVLDADSIEVFNVTLFEILLVCTSLKVVVKQMRGVYCVQRRLGGFQKVQRIQSTQPEVELSIRILKHGRWRQILQVLGKNLRERKECIQLDTNGDRRCARENFCALGLLLRRDLFCDLTLCGGFVTGDLLSPHRESECGHSEARLRPCSPLALGNAESRRKPAAVVCGVRHVTSDVFGCAIVSGKSAYAQ